MREIIIYSFQIAAAIGIFFFAGWQGMVVAILMMIIFDLLYKRIHGKSIAEIEPEDYHDHPMNKRRQQKRERP